MTVRLELVSVALEPLLTLLRQIPADAPLRSAGIGSRLKDARQFIRTDRMLVGLIELGVLGATLNMVLVYISNKLVHWENV